MSIPGQPVRLDGPVHRNRDAEHILCGGCHDDRPSISRLYRDADRGIMDPLYRLPGEDQRPAGAEKLRRPDRAAGTAMGPARASRLPERGRSICAFRGAGHCCAIGREGEFRHRVLGHCFFWLRLAHAIVYWAAIPYLRTILFTLAFVAEAGIFWESSSNPGIRLFFGKPISGEKGRLLGRHPRDERGAFAREVLAVFRRASKDVVQRCALRPSFEARKCAHLRMT